MSRYESLMRSRIALDASFDVAAPIELRIAAYAARMGDFVTARRIIVDIRAATRDKYSSTVFCAINYAEGVVQYFEQGADSAIEKFQRSVALSIGCSVADDLPSLVLAWMANCHRLKGQWSAEFSALRRSIDRLSGDSPEVLERICLVVSDSLQEICDRANARKWYDAARRHALRIGDDSAVSAVLYNRIALEIFNARIDRATGSDVDLGQCMADVAAFSAENYSQHIGGRSMAWAFRLIRGQLALLKGDYSEAYAQLAQPGLDDQLVGWPAVEIVRRSDLCLVRAHLFDINSDEILDEAGRIISEYREDVGSGDLAIAAHSLIVAIELKGGDRGPWLGQVYREAIEQFEHSRASCATEASDFLAWLESSSSRALVLSCS